MVYTKSYGTQFDSLGSIRKAGNVGNDTLDVIHNDRMSPILCCTPKTAFAAMPYRYKAKVNIWCDISVSKDVNTNRPRCVSSSRQDGHFHLMHIMRAILFILLHTHHTRYKSSSKHRTRTRRIANIPINLAFPDGSVFA